MKFISNKQYESIFSYFPGIDSYDGWELSSPAIYQCITSTNEISIPKFYNISDDPKYLLFKLKAGITYQLYNTNTYWWQYNLDFQLYDFLTRKNQNIIDGINYIKKGIVGNKQTLSITCEHSQLILAKITPVNDYSIDKNIVIGFSHRPINFDYSSHWIRDWENKVDGSKWDISGKVNSINNIQKIDRRFNKQIDFVPIWKNGIYIYALYSNYNFNSYENMQKYFNDIDDDMYQIIDSVNLNNTVLNYNNNVIAKMKFLYYSDIEQDISLYLSGYGELGICINDNKYYFSGYQSYYDSLSEYFNINLNKGFNEFIIYYNINSNYYYKTPKFIIKKKNEVTDSYYDLENSDCFLSNVYDFDKYISFKEIFESTCSKAVSDGYIHLDKSSSLAVFNDKIQQCCTISFWIRFKELKNVKQIPYNIVKSDNLQISRIEQNKLLLNMKFDANTIQYQFTLNQWHHICLAMSSSVISYYFDNSTNGYHIINNKSNYDKNYMFGKLQKQYIQQISGQFDIYDIIISRESWKQFQVNRIYNNVL